MSDLIQANEHQLDKLPDLPIEVPIYKHPLFIITILFVLSAFAAMILAALLHVDNAIISQFLTGSLTIHTTAGAGITANSVTRNQIYSAAAKQPLPNAQ